ncbi:MAG: hypothetical protein AAF196_17070 [Planctomycetota bacterium]
MNTPNLAQLKDLLSASDAPCISILLPTHRRHPEVQQDPIRLENLIKEAEQRAGSAGVDASILEPARALLPDEDFWNHQSDGLALFCRPDGMQAIQVPATLRECVTVGTRPAGQAAVAVRDRGSGAIPRSGAEPAGCPRPRGRP